MHQAHEALAPVSRIGFTATPFRASSQEELSLWEDLLYEYTPQDAMQDGVVVPPKLRTYDGPAETVDQACVEMISRAVEEGEGPGMVNALTIHGSDRLNSRGAETFADDLQDAGIRADTVHSQRTDAQNDRALQRLERGDLDCIVHVNQLAEGANFPWLRWLCLRRPVSSRTRFCQEVGRILRTHDDKEYGLLLDPNDLFDEFGLSYEAVLAGGAWEPDRPDQQAADDVDEAIEELKVSQKDEERTVKGTPVRALKPARAWLRKTKLAFQSVGVIDSKIKSTHWRKDRATDGQMRAVRGARENVLAMPDSHQKAGKVAVRIAEKGDWTKGEMSDLISILFAVGDHGWPLDDDRLIDQRA
jgi:type I site-specific restriction endonuclease